jgi:outer membrane protein TolC
MTTLGVMASQDLPFPGKRALRGQVAALDADQAQQQLERVRLRVAADVKRAYFSAIEARALITLTGEQRAVWQQIEGVARVRYSVGETSQQDVLRAQIELTRFDQILSIQNADLATRIAAINRLLDRPLDDAVPLAEPADDGTSSPEPAAEPTEPVTTPEVAGSQLGIQRAEAARQLAERNFKPDFSVQAGYMNRGSLDPMWQAGISISLPTVRSRLKAGLAEAEAQKASEEARLAAVGRMLEQRTHERRLQLDATQRSVQIYRKGLIPQDRLSVESALASYRTGRVPFVTVLDALNTLYADSANLTRLQTSAHRLRVALEERSLDSRDEPSAAGMNANGGSAIGESRSGDSAGMGSAMGR